MPRPAAALDAALPDGQTSHSVEVLGSQIRYVEAGAGRPVLFVHGNPTSSFLWRGVVPHVAPLGRCVAVDLVGMGGSDKPDVPYRFADHGAYFEGFVDALGLDDAVLDDAVLDDVVLDDAVLDDAVLVAHDWGVSLGLDLFARRPGLFRAVAWMEGRLRPVPDWDAFDEGGRALFQEIRTPAGGRRLVIEENVFVEEILPAATGRALSAEELAAYRAPYREPSSRLPLLRWAEAIPVGGEPADVARVIDRYRAALVASAVPKLLVVGDPGELVGPAEVAWCRRELASLTIAEAGPSGHFVPEDQPAAVGRAVAEWLAGLDGDA